MSMRMLRCAMTTLIFSAMSPRLALAADARRVDKNILRTLVDFTVSSTASRVVPATGETMGPLGADEGVEQGRFADVGPWGAIDA